MEYEEEKQRDAYEKAIDKFKKSKGEGYIALEKRKEDTVLIGNCRKETADIFDFYLMTDSDEIINADDVETITIIFKNEGKFAVQTDAKVFSCGYGKAECHIKKLLMYAKSEHIVMMFCFDSLQGILPLFDYDFYPNNMHIAPALQPKFEQVDDAVTNLYRAVKIVVD